MSGLLSIGSRAASLRRHRRRRRAASAHTSPTRASSVRASPTYLSPGEIVLPPTRSAPTSPNHLATTRSFHLPSRPNQLRLLAPPEPNQLLPEGARSAPVSPVVRSRLRASSNASLDPSLSRRGSRTPSSLRNRSRTPSPSRTGLRTASPSPEESHTPTSSPKESRTSSSSARGSRTPSLSPKGSRASSPSPKGLHTPLLPLKRSFTPRASLRGSSATTPLTPAVSSRSTSYSTFDSLPWGLTLVQHQVSVDDRRQLFSAGKLNVESAMSAYGSIVYQMRDANMDANSTCEFVYKALKVISKTVLMTVLLVLTLAVPGLMVIIGVQYLNECPLEPNIPIYLLVGGCFGVLKLLWLLCQQVRSRRYERIDDAFAEDSLDEIFTSTSYRATDVALTIFLVVWFGMGNYWVYRIYRPKFSAELYQPNDWCSKTLYMFAVAQLLFVYAVLGCFLLLTFCLACGQKCITLFGESYK
ncbi:uncharacterized protein [Panulirus ornatus]|uniref:uncharacterized protein isoform X1 n=1 Tax=Panulirus ornatus TaxID=150431 RepID=UPI003A8C7E3D